jgi:23S rRNA (uracil1939-C5)-methyltransferase
VDGKLVFVAGALPDERVLAARVKRHANYDEATATDILEPAAERVTPPCPAYERCGG